MHARALLLGSAWALLGLLGPGGAAAEDGMKEPAKQPAGAPRNRLASERSPYLRQHQLNPVDWWPWGPEALARAKALDRPIFLSIGYAACHWCHVMEHDSFEDEATAAALNDAFVCVKVDREERPDLDDVYMAATQITTGRGGWPMTCFLTPDGRPFLARTFIPRAELVRMTARLKQMWKDERPRLLEAADEVSEAVKKQSAGHALPPYEGSDDDLVRFAAERTTAEFDPEHGGFDRVPKFPPHAQLLFLLDGAGGGGAANGLAMVRKTLDAMAAGGVYDQVGGGFHRYSTDAVWLVPHFEKMLYDNALLATAYARAYAVGGEPRYAEVVRETLGWLEREMKVEGGGYASSLDADTEGEEGLTYTWTPEELAAALPAADAKLAAEAFDVRAGGNYHDEASGRPAGRSILHRPEPPSTLAARQGRTPAALAADLARIRGRLLEVRAKRAQPGRDGKVISGWNGLLVSAFAAAGTALKESAWHDRGRTLAAFLLAQAMDGGRLLRLPKGSGPRIGGFLDDHAHVAEGLLDLAEATGEPRWAEAAGGLADAILSRFRDPAAGGFFSSSTDHEALLARPKDAFDSPIPSGNATAARVLLRLAARTGSKAYREAADATLSTWRPLVARAPTGTMAMARALADRARLAAAGAAPEVADASVRRGVAQADVFLERGEAAPGSTVRFAIRLVLDPGWHVNPAGPGPEDRIPTTLELPGKAPVLLGPVAWPLPVVKVPALGQDAIPMLEGTVWIRASLDVPPGAALGPRKVTLVLRVQPCEAESCRAPVDLPLELSLRFGADAPTRHPTVFR